jgi:apolipoprotein N-acyltransferase
MESLVGHYLKNKKIVKRLSAFIAGGLVPLAYAPYELFFLVVISLSILFYLWSITDSAHESFILGYLFGFSMFGVGVNWLHISINLFGGINIVGALIFTYIFIAYLSLYPALCGYLASRFSKQFYIIVLPALWLITEWCRGWFLTGFPWLNIGASQTDNVMANFAPVFGVYGITFFSCLIAISIDVISFSYVKQHKLDQ